MKALRKRQTSKVHRRTHGKILEVRVMSPRIAWFGCLKFFGGLTKLTCVLAALAALGWGIWQGVHRAFYDNPDFRLQVIDLNENSAIDLTGLVETAGIDLSASLFHLDVDAIAAALAGLPEISSAHAERHLPGTLVVRVAAREPRAWVACPEAGFPAGREIGNLLVDDEGIAYRCPPLQFESAARLPIIHLTASDETPIIPGKKLRHPELQHGFRLLDAACRAEPDAIRWIESIEKTKEWALTLRTRGGTSAVFGTGDHDRQVTNLRAALDHASRQGYTIETINLLPKENVPITIRDAQEPPRAILVPEPGPEEILQDRRTRDLNALLNRD